MTASEMDSALMSLGWSGADLGRRVDVHANTVSAWRSGHREVPGSVAAYLRLALRLRELVRDL